MATGSVEAKIPISLIFGTGALVSAQSQYKEILATTFIYNEQLQKQHQPLNQ